MTKKYCHRCLMSFKSDGRLILHLKKDKKCKIINDKYNENYETQLMILIDKNYSDFEIDFQKYLVILEDKTIKHQCNLCKYIATDKYDIKKHLIEACSYYKYIFNADLLNLIENAKNPQFLIAQKNNKITLLTNDQKLELYLEHIDELQIKSALDKQYKTQFKCKLCNILFVNKQIICEHIESCLNNNIRTSTNELKLNDNLSELKNNNENIIETLIKVSEFVQTNSEFCYDKDMSNETEQNMNEEDFKQTIKELKQSMEQVKKEITQIKDNTKAITNNNTNNLQVLCLDSKKDLLEALTDKYDGDIDKALIFVKDCALSQMSGDIRLLEKSYLEGDIPSMWYLDQQCKNIAWLDSNGNKQINSGTKVVARKLASNLQNGYLKGMNHLINLNLDKKRCPNKFLADYDIQTWNNHIYDLRETKYQNRLISHLDIPIKSKEYNPCPKPKCNT